MKLASQQHQRKAGNIQHKVGISTTSTRSYKYSSQRWHHNKINMKLEIFSTKMASQQHQHEAGNLQHEAGITTTSTQRWKYLAQGWHHNNINTKMEIFSTRLASQQHQHEVGNIQHETGINTTPPFEASPFKLHQAYLKSAQNLHETEAWSIELQPVHLC
jgi:hypothetical protein